MVVQMGGYESCHRTYAKLSSSLQMTHMQKKRRPYAASTVLLNDICQFKFVLGLKILKVILSNTSALSKHLQGKKVDVINAKRNVDLDPPRMSR